MNCSNCGAQNAEESQFCKVCGQMLIYPTQPNVCPPQPGVYPPMSPMPMLPPKRRAFNWGDICTIFGFIGAIAGYFWAWVILCPVSLICSIIGFAKNRTRKLAVTGLVISGIGILIKISIIVYEYQVLPEWMTSGVF